MGRIKIITLNESPSREGLSAGKDWRRIIPGLIISAISLAVVFYFVDFQQMINAVRQAEAGAEYGKWKNWYRGDWLTGVYRTRQIAETFLKFLSDPLTRLDPPILWNGWEAYYHIMRYEGDRTADVN